MRVIRILCSLAVTAAFLPAQSTVGSSPDYSNPNNNSFAGAAGIPLLSLPMTCRVIWVRTILTDLYLHRTPPRNLGYDGSLLGASPIEYPNSVGNPNLSDKTIAQWFIPKAFAIAPQDVLGNAPRASFFGPGQNNWNLAVSRIFPVRERMDVRIRAEVYNAFNHPQWSGLNTSITSPGFGSVTSAMDPRTVQFSGRI